MLDAHACGAPFTKNWFVLIRAEWRGILHESRGYRRIADNVQKKFSQRTGNKTPYIMRAGVTRAFDYERHFDGSLFKRFPKQETKVQVSFLHVFGIEVWTAIRMIFMGQTVSDYVLPWILAVLAVVVGRHDLVALGTMLVNWSLA